MANTWHTGPANDSGISPHYSLFRVVVAVWIKCILLVVGLVPSIGFEIVPSEMFIPCVMSPPRLIIILLNRYSSYDWHMITKIVNLHLRLNIIDIKKLSLNVILTSNVGINFTYFHWSLDNFFFSTLNISFNIVV